jgi:maleate isomerase
VLRTADDLERYKEQFISGVTAAIEESLLAQPQCLIVGMSLEHILSGLEAVQSFTAVMRKHAGIELAVWHEAAHAALTKVRAKRIGLLTPFDQTGNHNAARLFSDLGYTVAVSVGFSCANALHIAHVPDWAKERAIYELLRPSENK